MAVFFRNSLKFEKHFRQSSWRKLVQQLAAFCRLPAYNDNPVSLKHLNQKFYGDNICPEKICMHWNTLNKLLHLITLAFCSWKFNGFTTNDQAWLTRKTQRASVEQRALVEHHKEHQKIGRAAHRYCEVMGSNPVEVLNFLQVSFCNCINYVHFDDHFFISFPQFT